MPSPTRIRRPAKRRLPKRRLGRTDMAHHPRRLRRLGDRRRRLGVRLGRAGRQAIDRRHPPCGRARRQLDRHRRRLRPRPLGGGRARRRCATSRARAAVRLHQVRAASGTTSDRKAPPRRDRRARQHPRARSRPRCARLGVERIDLYQMHWPAEDGTPIEEYWQTLLDLKSEGKVRAVGLSNHNVAQLEAAERIGHVDTLQPPFSRDPPRRRRRRAAVVPRARHRRHRLQPDAVGPAHRPLHRERGRGARRRTTGARAAPSSPATS